MDSFVTPRSLVLLLESYCFDKLEAFEQMHNCPNEKHLLVCLNLKKQIIACPLFWMSVQSASVTTVILGMKNFAP